MRNHNFSYFLHEGLRNMFSHGFMSFAAIGSTVACLLIMGTFTLVAVNANANLKELESENGVQYVAARRETEQVSLGSISEGEVLDALRRCQPDTLTPIEAMSLLYELKQKLS